MDLRERPLNWLYTEAIRLRGELAQQPAGKIAREQLAAVDSEISRRHRDEASVVPSARQMPQSRQRLGQVAGARDH